MARNAYGFETASIADATGPHTVSPLVSPFSAGIEGDLSTLLPPEPARRFRLLRDAVADINAIGHGLAGRLVDLTETVQRARRRLAEIKGQRGVDADHPEHIAQTTALANAQEELDRLNQRIASHEAIAGPRRALLAKTSDMLRQNAAGHDFAQVEIETPKLLKSETSPAMAIDRLRRRLRELNADRHRVESAPFPSAFAKQVAAEYLDKIAAAPIITNCVEHGGGLVLDGQPVEPPITFPTKQATAEFEIAAGKGVAIGYIPDIVGLVSFLCRDMLLAKIGELIDLEAEDEIALSWEQRREQLATIAADKEHVEREESFWIWQAFAAGTVIEPRPDADASAFLGVAVVEARPRQKPFDHADAFAVARRASEAAEGQPTAPPS